MKRNYQQLADYLCKLTEECLWKSSIFSDVISHSNYKLKTRTGCGLATYCKFNPREKVFTITYGKKMIESKFNQQQAKRWMTYREVLSRGYYNQNTSLINVLSHTVCHEFAHIIQQLTSPAIKGSIHNANFYAILDKIHSSDEANTVREKLENYFQSNAISIEYLKVPAIEASKITLAIDIDSNVMFIHKKKEYSGTVIKINKKTVHVKVKKLLRHTTWKVPKHCIEVY